MAHLQTVLRAAHAQPASIYRVQAAGLANDGVWSIILLEEPDAPAQEGK